VQFSGAVPSGTFSLPAERTTTWNPGFYSQGGIPNYTNVFATISAAGGGLDDGANIQSKLDAAGAVASAGSPQVVLLNNGTFTKLGTDPLWIKNPYVVLRGSGTTEIQCRTSGGAEIQRPPGTGADASDQPFPQLPGILIAPNRFMQGVPDEAFSRNLSADGVKGNFYVDLVSVTGLSVGNFVVLDEVSGANWQTDPQGGGAQVWARADYRIIWRKHNPERQDYFKRGDFTGTVSGTSTTINCQSITGQLFTPAVITGAGIPGGVEIIAQQTGSTGQAGLYTLNTPLTNIGPTAVHFEQYPTEVNSNGDFYNRLDRPLCEVKEITNISGNRVTFSTPLHLGYHTAYTAQVTKYNAAHIHHSGVENLTIRGSTGIAVTLQDAAYCWAKGVSSYRWAQNPNFNITHGFRCHVLSCNSYDCVYPRNAAGSYSLCFNWATADSIYEDCVSMDCDKVTLVRAAGRGCVYGYDYFDKGFIDTTPNWAEIGANASHFCGSSHVLFEGNYTFNADSDITAGPSNNITWFRNWIRGVRVPYADYWVVPSSYGAGSSPVTFDDTTNSNLGPARVGGLQATTYWSNFVGNVMGASGQMTGWVYEVDYIFPSNQLVLWYLGWDNGTDNLMKDMTFDGHVIRAGNYDFLTNSQKWEDGTVTGIIVNSLYLGGKPSFFASGDTWPWVDPTTGNTYNLPAKTRAAGLTAHPPP